MASVSFSSFDRLAPPQTRRQEQRSSAWPRPALYISVSEGKMGIWAVCRAASQGKVQRQAVRRAGSNHPDSNLLHRSPPPIHRPLPHPSCPNRCPMTPSIIFHLLLHLPLRPPSSASPVSSWINLLHVSSCFLIFFSRLSSTIIIQPLISEIVTNIPTDTFCSQQVAFAPRPPSVSAFIFLNLFSFFTETLLFH